MSRRLFEGLFAVSVIAALSLNACGDDSHGAKGACEAGEEGCACYPNKTCNAALSCLSNLCVDEGTGSATGGKTSQAGAPSFEAGAGGMDATSGGRSGGGGAGSSDAGAGSSDAGAGSSDAGANNAGPTPVDLHGALSVSGTELLDASGARVKLEGMSSMWLNWDAARYAESKEGLRFMRDNWNLRLFRAAMGVEPAGAYLEDPASAKASVNRIVQNAIDLGVYVIIDWHDHDALAHQAEATAFFREMSQKWGDYPNVIYEVFNEPLALDWASQLKPYHQALVSAIRANDPDNVIVLGTPNWDQDVDVAAQSPVAGKNLMYALHFYACSHRAAERDKAKLARSRGLPLFVTEWGATNADGGLDGLVCESDAQAWHDWLDASNISWAAWKLDGCTDSSCMFKDQSVPTSGGWVDSQLNGHARFVIEQMRGGAGMGTGGTSGTGGSSSTGGTSGAGGASGTGGTGGTIATGSGGSGGGDPFPPNPLGCGLVISSCTSCCETTGVFALDTLSSDATSQFVTAFNVSPTSASAEFNFDASDEIGAIFFRFNGAQEIGSLGVTLTGSGGPFEVALVRGGGLDGCIYPISGSSIASIPSICWGLGAGPYVGLPADQIEVRVRSLASGPASLDVGGVQYGP